MTGLNTILYVAASTERSSSLPFRKDMSGFKFSGSEFLFLQYSSLRELSIPDPHGTAERVQPEGGRRRPPPPCRRRRAEPDEHMSVALSELD